MFARADDGLTAQLSALKYLFRAEFYFSIFLVDTTNILVTFDSSAFVGLEAQRLASSFVSTF